MSTCYDKLQLGKLAERELCHPCSKYQDLVIKKKKQSEMGYRFQCKFPSPQVDYNSDSNSQSINSPARKKTANSISTPKRKPRGRTCNSSCVEESLHDSKICSKKITPHGNGTPPHNSATPKRKPRKQNAKSSTAKSSTYNGVMQYSRMNEEELQNAIQQARQHHFEEVVVPNVVSVVDVDDQLVAALCSLTSLKEELKCKEAEIKKLQTQLNLTSSKLRQKQRSMYNSSHYTKRTTGVVTSRETQSFIQRLISCNVESKDVVTDIIAGLMSKKSLRKEVSHVLQDHLELLPELSLYIGNKLYEEVKYKFRPWICLQQLDLQATVSFRSFDIIRKIEFIQDEKQRYRRGLLPSRSSLGRACRQLELFGENILPYEVTGNYVKFNVAAATKFIFERYGLAHAFENDRTRTAVLSATVDGGDLAWGLTQVSAGIKIVDPNAKNPETGELLFGDSGYDRVQSRNHCFPLHVFIAKDNKELYQTHLSSFFNEVNALEDAHRNSLKVIHGADMCSLQKTVGRGGAMKNKIYACYCCDIHRDDLCKPNAEPCSDCIRLGRTEPCYHRPVSDANWRERLSDEKRLLCESYSHLNHFPFSQPSRIRFTDDAVNEAAVDPMSIEFQPQNIRQKMAFRSLLESELRLRKIRFNSHGDLNELRLVLRELLLSEARYSLLVEVLEITDDKEALIRLEQALPCLLHLENRTAEAIIEHLLRRGMLLREGCKEAQKRFMAAVESIVNEEIFGAYGCPSNWRFPVNLDGSMGAIKFANWRARRIVENLSAIIDLCFLDDQFDEEREKWKEVVQSYRTSMELLMQREDFTGPQIDNYQSAADKFFSQWISLVGYSGITNYIHMIGAGHIRYYLQKWGNLNRFSNQGWEAYNAMITSFWHHRTRKGGGKLKRSKILPIAQWILRLMLWRTGEAKKYFQSLEENDDDDSWNSDECDAYDLA
jgi:hypothetical protein